VPVSTRVLAMREPSASLLGLVPHCSHPFNSGLKWPEDRSDAADFGKRVHLAVAALGRPEAAYPACFGGLSDSERDTLLGCVEQAREYLSTLAPALAIEAEIWLRYSVGSGAVRRPAHRMERREEGDLTAILDHVRIQRRRVHLIDWKTGTGAKDRAANNWQLRLQALAAAEFFGVPEVHAEIVTLDRDRHTVDGVTWGRWDLLTLADELRELRRTWTGGPTPPVPGSHCTTRYCPLRGVCSATAAALAVAAPIAPLPRRIETDDDARRVTELLPQAQAALDGLKAQRDEYARRSAFDIGGGFSFGWKQHETRSVKADTEEQRIAVVSVLGDFAREHAIRVSHDITIGGIEKAAAEKLRAEGSVTPSGQVKGKKALVDRALAALEKTGGYRVTTWEKAEAFERKEST